jgi:tetratricopeptide (TPR) repeat protein
LRAKALWGAGVLAIRQGDYSSAERLLTDSLTYAREVGDSYWTGFALNGLGTVAIFNRDLERATSLHEEGLALLREVDDQDGIAALLGNLGNTALVQEDYDRAVARSEESLERYRALESLHGMASMVGTLGRSLIGQGDLVRAETVLREGLHLCQELGNKWYTTVILEGLVGLAAAKNQPERAVMLLGAIRALVEANAVVLHPSDLATNERVLNRLRAQLDEATFAEMWELGRATPLEQIIAAESAPGRSASDTPLPSSAATEADSSSNKHE